jgi:hypothetical protein
VRGDPPQYLWGQGVGEEAGDDLIARHPVGVVRVGDALLLAVLISDGHLLRWLFLRAIKETHQLGTSDRRNNLCLPQQGVDPGQLLGDPMSKSGIEGREGA